MTKSTNPNAPKPNGKKTLTPVLIMHYVKLGYRSVLFLLALAWYIQTKLLGEPIAILECYSAPIFFVIWLVFMIEMLLRLFPSPLESPGCQKQFKQNYMPTGRVDAVLHDNHASIIVILAWILLNGTIAALHMLNVIDDGILVLIALAYSLCDMICILFYCPFQSIFLKNRCCVTCRIYNWDYTMMFTPLFFIPGFFTWTLLGMALIILLRWEITVWRFPERFSDNTNSYMHCVNCNEKLCMHKKQLRSFHRDLKLFTEKQYQRMRAGYQKLEKK